MTFLCLLLAATAAMAQISVPGTPPSFLTKSLNSNVETLNMPALNMDAIHEEDRIDEENGLPPRFGFPFEVDYDLSNSGTWEEYPTGGKVWRLRIKAQDALSINLCYSEFYMPEGGQFYIYSADRSHVIGAFTSLNNKPTGGFATGLVYGDDVILEYFEPAGADPGQIRINKIVSGYRYIDVATFGLEGADPTGVEEDFGGSGGCQVNINCPEGSAWQDEKRSVAMILVSGTRWCSGSLVSTTRDDCTPYFLTADHCLTDGYDAVSNPNMTNWSFYWMYESPGCTDGSAEPIPFVTNGATLVANDAPSDFALLLLSESPVDAGANPYFNGWNATTSIGSGGVGIHHPSGDIRKIATHSLSPAPDNWFGGAAGSHWEVLPWDATPNGQSVTEGGSSGSPLFNANGQVVGQLHGGSSINCSNPSADPGIYGAVWYSWDNAGATDPRRRLRDWLDPDGTGALTHDGTYGDCSSACFSPSGLESSLSGGSTVLTWNPIATATGGYNYRYRETGTVTWTTASTASSTATIGGLASCSEYEWQVQSICDSATSSFSPSATFVSDGCPCPVYCEAAGNTTVDEWIDNVVIGPLSNPSGENGGYVNFTGVISANYDQGSTYSVTLTPGYTSTIYSEYFKIYIDYNQDGDFSDAGEEAYDAGATVSGTSATGSLTIPATALSGETGMRVIMRYSSAPSECGTFTYGEVEDYCITIGGEPCTTAPTGMNSSVGGSAVLLNWDAVPGSVACQVSAVRTVPLGGGGTRNIVGTEPTSLSVPISLIGSGTTWDWQVRCACNLDPIVGTPFSAWNSFTVPAPRMVGNATATIFPNPTSGKTWVDYETAADAIARIRVINTLGQTVLAQDEAVFAGNNRLELNTNQLSGGTYIVEVVAGDNFSVETLLIEK